MTGRQRLQQFLYSRKNIGASLLALAGVALLAVGVLPSLLVGIGAIAALYAVGYLLIPGERGVKFTLMDARDTQQIRQGLNDLVYSLRFRVSNDVMAAVESCVRSINLTLPPEGAPGMTAIDPTVMLIRQTALHYVPQALDAYLAIPRIYAERVVVQEGKTARDVLIDQLKMIDDKMRETAEAMYHYDASRLLSNARFLQERFADSNFKVPVVDLIGETQSDKVSTR
jgi:hypothetical protein